MLAPYLEKAIHALSRKEFLLLLIVLIFLFYLLPTCFYYQIMEDSGKGLVNMITVYLIGRYLRAYPIKLNIKNWGMLWATAFSLTFGLNMILSFLVGSVKLPFARDNSIFILIQAVAAFHIFANTAFVSEVINKFAGFVFPIYIYIYNNIVLDFRPPLLEENLVGLTITGMAIKIVGTILLTITICIGIEFIRRLLFIPVYKWVFPVVEHILFLGKNQIEIILDQIISTEEELKP